MTGLRLGVMVEVRAPETLGVGIHVDTVMSGSACALQIV